MVKEKKIAVKHYLNKNVKPREAINPGYFPIYSHVTYDRKTTNVNLLKSINKKGVTEFEFEQIIKGEGEYKKVRKGLNELENFILNLIRHEVKMLGNDFTLIGISKRYVNYLCPITEFLNLRLITDFAAFLEEHLTVKQYKKLFNIHTHSYEMYPTGEKFLPLYAKVKNEHLPDIRERIRDQSFEVMLTSFVLMRVFENINGKQVNADHYIPMDFRFIDWIEEGEFRTKFINLGKIIKSNHNSINYNHSDETFQEDLMTRLLVAELADVADAKEIVEFLDVLPVNINRL